MDSWLGILLKPLSAKTALVTTTVGCLPVEKDPPFGSGPGGYFAHTGLLAFTASGCARHLAPGAAGMVPTEALQGSIEHIMAARLLTALLRPFDHALGDAL